MDIKKLLPHFIGIAVLLLVSAFFFAPNFFSGKVLPQPDNDKARGMQTELRYYNEKENKTPLWTNSAFGGMPAYQIHAPVKGNLTVPVLRSLFLFTDSTSVWAQVFVAMLCTYLLLIVMGADWRVAVVGAVAYGITTYNIDILEAGHSTKMSALALMPGFFAGLVLTFQGRRWLGTGLMALFMGMQLYANHMQITYYMLLLSGIYILAQLGDVVRHGAWKGWALGIGLFALSVGVGFLCNLSRVWPTYEYSQETIRGGSDLKSKAGQNGGLEKDYLFGWSVGISESLSILVPHAHGAGSNESIQEGKFFDMVSRGASPNEKVQIGHQVANTLYWGEQPFVGTAIYYGAIVCFLFLLGAFLVPGNVKWWLLASGLFCVSLAWGKYFFLNHLLYSYFPMFNKFRAVSMALGPGQFCFAVLGAMGLQKLFDSDIDLDKKKKALMYSAGATLFFCLITMIIGGGAGLNDAKLAEQLKLPNLSEILIDDRTSLARSDAMRSMAFILAAAGILWFALRGQLKAGLAVMLVGGLALADHWTVCSRTLSSDNYENKRTATAPPKEEEFDRQIKQDKDLDYRVLDLSRGGIAGNATTSYFHKSLSGYHAAKLQLYQEVIDSFLNPDLGHSLHIVGMLNGKYIVTQKGQVIPNPEACGNAWFVKHYNVVPDADAELNALHKLNPKDTAVIQQSFASSLNGLNLQPDTTARIKLTAYYPDKMEYEYSCKSDQLALFSEVYYPPSKGWKCFINGQPAADFVKADYLLRAMRLPAGSNMKLEMRFEPRSYYLGETISYVGSILVLALLGAGLFFWYRNRREDDPNKLEDIEAPKEERPARTAPAPVKGKKK